MQGRLQHGVKGLLSEPLDVIMVCYPPFALVFVLGCVCNSSTFEDEHKGITVPISRQESLDRTGTVGMPG